MTTRKIISFFELMMTVPIIKMLVRALANILSLPLILLLLIFLPIKHIKLFTILCEGRIGEFGLSTDILIRKMKSSKKRSKFKYIGFSNRRPANRQLFNMFKREITIIELPVPILFILKQIINKDSLLGKTNFFISTEVNKDSHYDSDYEKKVINFSASERRKGINLLNTMSITSKDWFVCLHARDPAYLSSLSNKGDQLHGYRNWDINNAIMASEFITSKGGYVLRLGAKVEKKLISKNKKIIDYATRYRTDFGDIYLCGNCRFYIGTTAGLLVVPTILNVPVIGINYIPLELTPFRKGDLFIPKKIWSNKLRRFLTFREILDRGMGWWDSTEQYDNAGLTLIENTPSEILDVVKEMFERVSGSWKATALDEQLQKEFKRLFMHTTCAKSPARIGAKFLRENRNLLK
ncbi:MAG: TIGR04372 family glycosyltransferase [Nanoarchaeota archaeon]|nr:TIGR04372 family glycosyltransferase [Nanoarchaeota archaeon]